jgi:parallel beta-helix repeat protein
MFQSSNCTIARNVCDGNAYGILLSNDCDDNVLIENICDSNAIQGITVGYSDRNLLLNNTCNLNDQHGIVVGFSHNVLMNNTCHGNDGFGIFLENAHHSIVRMNSCTGNAVGIRLQGSTDNILEGNDCSYNNEPVGIKIGISLRGSHWNTIANNSCMGNGQAGIRLESSDNNTISGNTLSGNGIYGLSLYGSDKNSILNNTLANNIDEGLFLTSSDLNAISGNVAVGNNGSTSEYDANSIQAYDDGTNFWNGTANGNLWSDWTAPDANGDGIVDEPYLINGGSSRDQMPLAMGLVITSPIDGFATTESDIYLNGALFSYLGATQVSWSNAATGDSGVCVWTDAWNATVPLAEGSNLITVTMVDASGVAVSDKVTVIRDITPPSLVISSPIEGEYVGSSVTVSWIGDDLGAGISYYHVSIESLASINTTGTSYTFNSLVDGVYTVLVSAFDNLGNYRDETVTFTVDSTAPTLVITFPTEGVMFNSTSITLSWNTSDANLVTVQVSIDGAAWETVNGNQVVRTMANGPHTVRVNATDQAGNFNESTVRFTVDTDVPTVAFISPAEGALVNATQGIVEWEAEDATSMLNSTLIRVDGGEWTELGAATGWIYSLEDGPHTIEVKVTDLAGNSASASLDLTVDTTAPTAENSPTGDDLELDLVITVEFSEIMNETSVSIIVSGVTGTTAWEGNATTFTPSGLQYGTAYSVTVSGKDLAGNAMEMNWTFRTTAGSGGLSGVLVDQDGDPIANVTVRVGDRTAITDELGRFILNDLAPGNYVLTVDAEGYEMYSDTVAVVLGETGDLGELTLVTEGADGDDDGDGGSLLIYVLVAIVALLAVGVAVFFLWKKK